MGNSGGAARGVRLAKIVFDRCDCAAGVHRTECNSERERIDDGERGADGDGG
ncbi:MAG TPA: hypothetical protein VGH87_26655 [Polyangiaceae bacterium]